MHPEDERYAEYTHGQTLELEWINGPITATVIKDASVDKEFGTGVMTITPWHDATDFEIAERHTLDKEQIIDERGKLLPIAGEFAGMKITEAREKIVEKLKNKGLLEKVDAEYVHNVKTCYKCNTPIEPQIRTQWFVKMESLAKMAFDAVEAEKITFIPENFKKIFQYWMSNTIDWNISRQIVWGIPILAKICDSCGAGFPDLDNTLTSCAACGGAVSADTDTFDTWFSSGQWPLLSLGYSGGEDFKTYHPTDIMETGHDLIFKWIPRMVIFSLYLTKDIPFHTVYLHGLVNDAQGKKMSKSKGNVISPIDLVEKYGADALRMGLVVGNAPGTDLALREDKIKGYKHFSNKLWNIARFVLENAPEVPTKPTLTATDEAYIKELNALTEEVTANMETRLYHIAAEKLYAYIWNTFASSIIEETKIRLREGSGNDKESAKYTLHTILSITLTLLHPFMPFVTETIWEMIPTKTNVLIVESWPVSHN
jgi:valyl-tRNA synthetase